MSPRARRLWRPRCAGWMTWKPGSRRCTPRSRRLPAARRLQGPGPGTLRGRAAGAAVVWAFLGDARRFSSSAQAVRHTGLDITVHSSDDKRTLATCRIRDRPSCAGHCSKPATGITRYLPGPRLLRRRRRAHRRQPGCTVGRPQASPPLPPHPAPPRRRGLRSSRPESEADAGERGGPYATMHRGIVAALTMRTGGGWRERGRHKREHDICAGSSRCGEVRGASTDRRRRREKEGRGGGEEGVELRRDGMEMREKGG